MDNASTNQAPEFKIKLSKVAEITSLAIALTILFQLIRNYIYYTLYLHIPIFQYLSISDLPLLAPTFLWWVLYYGSVQAAEMIRESIILSKVQRIFYGILLYSFAIYLTVIGFRNDPIIREGLVSMKYNFWWLMPLIAIYVVVRLKAKENGNDFFERNKLIAVFFLTIWWGTYDAWSSYWVIANGTNHLHYILKLKNGKQFKIDGSNLYIGRTNNYWFVYNKKAGFTHAIKNDDVDIIDFDSKNE